MEGIQTWWEGIQQQFYMNFIEDDRWKYLWNGLGVTLQLTFCAVLIGIVLGVILAMIRSTYDKNYQEMRPGFGRFMIMYYIILASSNNKLLVGMIAFGVNSGAYVAEIVRSGIMSIDPGQFEAGRSLGFNYVQTMRYIIIPQALKNVLPALANEFIVLLKETSVAGYIAMQDLTKGGDIIRGVTYSPFMPLIGVALIYLVMVMFFTFLVNKLERRLRNSER